MSEDSLTSGQIQTVQRLAATAAEAVRAERAVLVRCHSGHNRSGLVVAQTLVELGWTPTAAVEAVRAGRSQAALNNEVFVDYVTTGLDIARLLVDLDAPA
ncbi:hypothetical protein [Streptomyces sp. NPDC048659]|uniref:hypothetical protein n=1 Tax=Streptomyces sp. NPDC048659 TaxID=3155489 RepID=UPI003422EA2A